MSILPLSLGFRGALLAALAAGLCACDTRPVIVDGMLEWEDDGTPSNAGTAARHVITSNNPDWRRKGVAYLADEDFGGEPAYLKTYRTLGLTDKDASVRAASARALGEHGGPEEGAAIVPLLADKDPMARLAAADALRKIELSGEAKNQAEAGLIKLLTDEDVDVRAKAADALGHFPSERALRALMDALEDPSYTVVNAVHRSLVLAVAGEAAPGAAPVDFGLDARQWGQWLGAHKGALSSAYLYEPWYRRPSAVQWGDVSPWWSPWGWGYTPPEGVAPRAKPLREGSAQAVADRKAAPQGAVKPAPPKEAPPSPFPEY